jgi:choline dehydrogenase
MHAEFPVDHDEISIIWRMKQNFTLLNGCKFLSDPAQDPCLAFWTQSNHGNVYSFGPNLAAVISESSPNRPEPDILTYFIPSFFRGFVRGEI